MRNYQFQLIIQSQHALTYSSQRLLRRNDGVGGGGESAKVKKVQVFAKIICQRNGYDMSLPTSSLSEIRPNAIYTLIKRTYFLLLTSFCNWTNPVVEATAVAIGRQGLDYGPRR